MGDATWRAWEIANRHRDGSLPQTPSDNVGRSVRNIRACIGAFIFSQFVVLIF